MVLEMSTRYRKVIKRRTQLERRLDSALASNTEFQEELDQLKEQLLVSVTLPA